MRKSAIAKCAFGVLFTVSICLADDSVTISSPSPGPPYVEIGSHDTFDANGTANPDYGTVDVEINYNRDQSPPEVDTSPATVLGTWMGSFLPGGGSWAHEGEETINGVTQVANYTFHVYSGTATRSRIFYVRVP